MTSSLQTGRYDQLIRRVGGIIGPGSKVSEALSELFPVIDVEKVPGELMILGGTALCWGGIAPVGAADERPRTQIFNPVGSGKLITVTTLVVGTGGTDVVRYTITPNALTTGSGTERFRDGRFGPTDRPVGQIRQDSTVAITDAIGQFIMPGSRSIVLNDENGLAVLDPGFGFEVGIDQTAGQIFSTFHWRERVALESELNLP